MRVAWFFFNLLTGGVIVSGVEEYDELVSRRQVGLASIAYCKDKNIQDWTCVACRNYLDVVNVTTINGPRNSRGYVAFIEGETMRRREAENFKPQDEIAVDRRLRGSREGIEWEGKHFALPSPGMILVAFAGTDPSSIRNWIDDLEVFPAGHVYESEGCVGCKVHMGFLATSYAIQDQVRSKVAELLEGFPGARVAVTGHSLGGALAILSALDLKSTLPGLDLAPVYTFGAPRLGNGAFAAFAASQGFPMYRVIHNRDPVPHLPFTSWGYVHPPQEVLYDQSQANHTLCSTGTGEDTSCSDRFSMALDLLRVDDHLNYLGVDFTNSFINCALFDLL
ncbi:unnamed protein product [Discosporangium mesarthrocarpum]